MQRIIVVSGGCQAAGVAAALQQLLINDEITAIPLSDPQLLEHISRADIWLTSGRFELYSNALAMKSDLILYKMPELIFCAFHPDLIYIKNTDTNDWVQPHYQSAICVWAYKHRLTMSEAVQLFTPSIFRKLGYFSMWSQEWQRVSLAFAECGLDIQLFMPYMIRQGGFMHAINHPNITTLIRLAQIIANKIDSSQDYLSIPVYINDGLIDIVWPIYPDIADFYALAHGMYRWKLSGHHIVQGLDQYIAHSYQNLQTLGVAPGALSLEDAHLPESQFDLILNAEIKAQHG
jgi:hypothetical protein